MRLITVRHGESESNISGVTAGWMDVELSDEGLRQAKKVALRLKNENIDAIFSSDLKRAVKTAEEIAKYHDCEVVLDKRLREQNRGRYEGGPGKNLWADLKASGKNILEWKPENGESFGEVKKRFMNFLSEIEKKYKNKTVLVVSHGVALSILSRHFHNDFDLENNHSHKNTSVSEYSFDGEKWNVVKFNCVEHLE